MMKSTELAKFSVLLSVYYKENPKYFDEALTSVFSNTLIPNEVVIVKDGRLTPELDTVIERFCSLYPKIIKVLDFPTNRGLGAALADGVKMCTYDLIARMDTDDICYSKRFEYQINYLAEHPDIDLLGATVVEYDENMQTALSKKNVPEHDLDIKKYIQKRNPFNHMSVVFRRDSVLKAGNYQPMLYFEDYYLWCRMSHRGCHFYNFQEPLVKVRGGISMLARRGGFSYTKCIWKFEKELYHLGIINVFRFFSNVGIRIVVSLLPVCLRKRLYEKKLRKEI